VPNLLEVIPVDAGNRQAVIDLAVRADQLAFVGRTADMLAVAGYDPGSLPMAVLLDGRVIGSYLLEVTASVITGSAFPIETRAVRSLMLDAGAQGRGLGVRAIEAMIDDARRRYPEARQLALTVNLSNTAACRAYARAGFIDGGERYHGGRAGPLALYRYVFPEPGTNRAAIPT
jgi:RimJ/RimL family protein N-acetyltransferase